MKSALTLLVALVLGLSGCGRPPVSTATDAQTPSKFMTGGTSFPEATGYWFDQYIERDELVTLISGMDFLCKSEPAEGSGAAREPMRCERRSRYAGGLLSRSDSVRVSFRANGTIESAEAGCVYTFFDSPKLSGTCKRFVALGAVYPSAEVFAQLVSAMLRPDMRGSPIDVTRLEAGPVAPLKDANEAVDRLTRWRFACNPGRQHRAELRGEVGETKLLRCQQYSLRPPEGSPQSQQVLVHYDSVDLAVLGVEVRLDGAPMKLPEAINTPTAERAAAAQPHVVPEAINTPTAERAAAAPPRLQLETISGQRIELPASEVGTGSAELAREFFESLTPASQRDLLQAHLDKVEVLWPTPPRKLSLVDATSLRWYGPQALPHLHEMLSDERPLQSAAVLKYLCKEAAAARNRQRGDLFHSEPFRYAMRACVGRHRDRTPKSIATLDRLLAQDLREFAASDAAALNAYSSDFPQSILFTFALGPDAKEARPALAAAVAGKVGLVANLQVLIDATLTPRPGKSAAQLLAELDEPNPGMKRDIMQEMAWLGDAATPVLLAILREGTSPKMDFVSGVFCLRGPDAAGAIPELMSIIDASARREPRSPWPSLYAVSALACVGRKSPEATRYLISLLKGPDPNLQSMAAKSLEHYPTTDVVLALGETLSDPNQGVREIATGSLFRMGPKAGPAIPMLARAVDQQKGMHQAKMAADALRAIGTPEALAELRARGLDR